VSLTYDIIDLYDFLQAAEMQKAKDNKSAPADDEDMDPTV